MKKILKCLVSIIVMENLKEQAIIWKNKLKLTTKTFMNLPEDTKLPNGWGKRELALHLEGWDEEMIKVSKHLIAGKPFIWTEYFPEDLDLDEVNQSFLDRNKKLSSSEAVKKFHDTREKLIGVYIEIIENYFQDDKRLLDYYSLWGHDVQHLKQAGVDTKEIES